MQLTVHGNHVDVGMTYQSHVKNVLKNLEKKYKIEIISAHVQLSKSNVGFTTDLSAHIGRGVFMRGSDSANDALASVDAAAQKLDTKLRKHKGKLANHHQQRNVAFETALAPHYVISSDEPQETSNENQNKDLAPPIIAEGEEAVPVLSVSDAVFYFDLSDKEAMLFKNAGSGAINMLYRRKDGNLGWVEAKQA